MSTEGAVKTEEVKKEEVKKEETPTVSAAEFAKLKAEHDAAQAALKARADEDKKKADDEKVKQGQAAEVIKAKEAELASAAERIKAFEKQTLERAEGILSKLPKAAQEKLTKHKNAMSLDAWASLVEDEAVSLAEAAGSAPFLGGHAGGGNKGDPNAYKPSNAAREILVDKLMKNEDSFKDLRTVRDPESTAVKFSSPINVFFAKMTKATARGQK